MTAEIQTINTLVVGAGQAGIAASEHLSQLGVEHLVLERQRIAQAWRTGRWDSLVANGPAWHDRFPGLEFKGDRDGFPGKDEVADYFEDYVRQIKAPVRTGVEVRRVTRNQGRPGFTVQTSEGVIEARNVIAATGPFQVPVIPPIAPAAPADGRLLQIHSAHYHRPAQLPEGAVLVVGAGSSGVQIADELQRAGRKVFLSVGAHDRPPRAYRGRDFCWWLGVLGEWDAAIAKPGREHVTIAVSGARGGHTVDFRALGHQGITLVGLTESFADGSVRFRDDLAENIVHLVLARLPDALPGHAGCGRRLHPPQRPGPARGARGAQAPARSGVHDPSAARTRPGCRRHHLHHLGHGLQGGLQLAAGGQLRARRQATPPPRRGP